MMADMVLCCLTGVVFCRTLMYLPLYTLGMANPDTVIWVPLFDDYQEQSDIPFAVFQATLQVCLATMTVMLHASAQPTSPL